jgi:hypothetical protein
MSKSQVLLIVLKSGEQILANAEAGTNEFGLTGFHVKKPAILVPSDPNQEGQRGIGLLPWMPYTLMAEEGFIPHDSINYQSAPIAQLSSHYMNFATGLVVPTKEVAAPKLQLVE